MDIKLKALKNDQQRIFERSARILNTLASPVRLQILHFLSQVPHSVEVLAEKIGQSVANTSMHLRKMQSEKILKVVSNKQKRIYSLAHPSLLRFWEDFQDFGETQDPSLKLDTADIYGEIDWEQEFEEIKIGIERNNFVLLDVRPRDEMEEGQLKGVKNYLHIPDSELKNKLSKLSKKKDILVFCRGRNCAFSARSVDYLRSRGYKAWRLRHSWFSLRKNLSNKELS